MALDIVAAISVLVLYADYKIKEPEFINSYCIMKSDDSFESLPREIGTIQASIRT